MAENFVNRFSAETVKEEYTSKLDKLQTVRTVNTFSDNNIYNTNNNNNNNITSNNNVRYKTKCTSEEQNTNNLKSLNHYKSKPASMTKILPLSSSSSSSSSSTLPSATKTIKLTAKFPKQKTMMEDGQEKKQEKKNCPIWPSAHVIQAAQIKLAHWHVTNLQHQSNHLTQEREALLDTMECVVNEHERQIAKLKEQMKEREAAHVESIRALHIRREACERYKQEVLEEIEQMHNKIQESQRTRDELHELLVLENEKLSEECVTLDEARVKYSDAQSELSVQRQEEIKMSDDAYGLHGEAKEVMLHIKLLIKEIEKAKHDAMAEELTRRVLFSRCEELKGTIRVYCRVKAPQHVIATVHDETITNTEPQTSHKSIALNTINNNNKCTELYIGTLRKSYKRQRSTSAQTLISPQINKSVKVTHVSLRSTSVQKTPTQLPSSRSCSTKEIDEHLINNNVEEYCGVELQQIITPSRSTDPTETKLLEEEESEKLSLESNAITKHKITSPSIEQSPSPSPSPSPPPYEEEWKSAVFPQTHDLCKEYKHCSVNGKDNNNRCRYESQEIANNTRQDEEEEEESTSCNEQHIQVEKERSESSSLPNNLLDNNKYSISSNCCEVYNTTSDNNSSVEATATIPTQKLFTFDHPRFDADARHENDTNKTISNNTTNSDNHLFRSITAHQSRANATSTGVVESSESFYYDCVFAPQSTQADIYVEIEPLVHNAIDGYRICVFAYGQTGSGKTYTMEGDLRCNAEYGVIPRAMETIFRRQIELVKDGWIYELSCTIIEIHNEVIYDLTQNPSLYVGFTPSSSSSWRVNSENSTNHNNNSNNNSKTKHTHSKCYHTVRHSGDGTFVSNVQEHPLHNMHDFINVYQRAICNRHTAKTLLNTSSSRSHCIFTLYINGTNATLRQRSRGVLCLVDLAGSERVNESGATGSQFKEAVKINRSLLDLGKCITAMQTNAVVPWRNSLLTYLLQNYMNAKGAKTLMIVTVSDQAEHLPESVNSLRFAQRVQQTLLGKSVKQVTSYEAFSGKKMMTTTD